MLSDRYVLEVAIYRRSEDKFWTRFEKDRDEHMARPELARCSPDMKLKIEDRFHRAYPAPWHFNEAIGFIRVFVLWDQIRGVLFLADGVLEGRRFDRRAKKRFCYWDKTFEMHPDRDQDNARIGREIHDHLVAVGKGLRRKGVVVDTEVFDNITPFVDWRAMMAGVEP